MQPGFCDGARNVDERAGVGDSILNLAPGANAHPVHDRDGVAHDFKALLVDRRRPQGAAPDEDQVPGFEDPTRDRVG